MLPKVGKSQDAKADPGCRAQQFAMWEDGGKLIRAKGGVYQ